METLDRLHAQAETVNHDYQTAKENLAGAQRELEQLYAASENIAQKMREKDLESERTREQISEAESAAAECESAAAVVRTNLQNSADSIARLRVEVSEQADRASALQAQIDALTERRKGLYEWKRRGMDVTQELSAVNERLRQTRRSLNLCQSIEADIPRLQTQTQQYREQRAKKEPEKRKYKQQER